MKCEYCEQDDGTAVLVCDGCEILTADWVREHAFKLGMTVGAAIIQWAKAIGEMAKRMRKCRRCGCDVDDHADDEDGRRCGYYDFGGYGCDCQGFFR